MVEEAYVSFETAKLLKEKGFNESCYQKYDNEGYLSFNHVGYINNEKSCDDFCALAPTQQMAMRWLREEYKLAINIRIACKKTISYVFDIWDFEIIHPNKFVGGTIDLREQQFDFKSYEQAAEAAIKYCLENLI